MTPDERTLIADLFARLKAADTAPRDTEAEAAIRDAVARHPGAPYLLTQTVLVQEHALKGAEARIAELERQISDAQRAQPPASSGSFLGGLLGNRNPPAQPSGPWGRRVEPEFAPRPAPTPSAYQAPLGSGGGFLRSALTTAAGVAGGALLFQGIERMLGYGSGPFGSPLGSGWSNASYTPVVEERETIVNNYYGDSANSRSDDSADNSDQQDYDDSDQTADSGSYDDGGDSLA